MKRRSKAPAPAYEFEPTAVAWSFLLVVPIAYVVFMFVPESLPYLCFGTLFIGMFIARLWTERIKAKSGAGRALAVQHTDFDFAPRLIDESPREFEHKVAALIEKRTGKRARVCGGAGDGGIDIEVFDNDRRVGIVQCKRYRADRVIAPATIRELYGVKLRANVPIAYLVTTARFSEGSRTLANDLGIRLIDGSTLEKMAAA